MTATLHGHLAVVGALLLLATGAARAEPKSQPETDRAGAKALAAKIDERFARHWQDKKVRPAPLADDAELLRRVYLDLAGRIPSAGEARRFLDDKAPDKRQRLVDALLDSPAHVNHWINVWRPLLLPELKLRTAVPSFETWLRTQLELNVGYDKLARDLLTTPIDGLLAAGTVVFVPPTAKPSALWFYAGKKAKPEVLAASTARLFLGVRIECAQCHDHPFAEWKQEQFWEYAAFFAGLEAPGDPRLRRGFRENPAVRKIVIADTGKFAAARFLDGSEPKPQDKVGGRQALADWVTAPKNPYFARAAANRLWAYFLGTGLIEPVDEMVGKEVQDNDPGGLLDELAKGLVAHDFDLKFLMRAITASKVYQLTSARTHASQEGPLTFARMAIRGLTGDQLFDSLTQATGSRGREGSGEFLSKFTDRGEKPAAAQTSIQQALALMNGRYAARATSLTQSRALAALTDFPLMTTAERVEALYLATLSRRPRPAELDRMVKYIKEAGTEAKDRDKASARALTDVFWMLLNCAEFKVNH
jgi:hypothetical protein